jgi:DNA invertase Pin-like site-specific DNA recombinase
MRAIAYLRVSTDEQANSGLGLEAQLTAIHAAATRLGVDVVATFTDAGVSGSTSLEDRPQLLQAVNSLSTGDVLLVAKRDRLGRDVVAVAMMEAAVARRNARIVSAAGEGTDGNDPASQLMRTMVDAFAEYERNIIRSRTKAALGAKKARGERVGSIPYGYRLAADGVRLEEDEAEQAVLVAVATMRAQGLSLRAIATALEAQGYTNRNGNGFNPKTVANMAAQAQ